MLSSSVQNSEGRNDCDSDNSFADPCQEFKEGFLGVCSGLPLFKSFSRIGLNISEGDLTKKIYSKIFERL
jgi:hypothetical protein